MYNPLIPDKVNCNSLQSLNKYAKPAIRVFPKPKGIWYKIGTIVLHLPPTTSIHITKEVIIVPPLAMAKKNLATKNPINHGDHADRIPQIDCMKMHMIKIFFLPHLSAATPNTMFPGK